MINKSIAFIGGGNMTRSLVGGLVNDGYDTGLICVADPDAEQRQWFTEQFGIKVMASNTGAIAQAEVVILAVKPQVLHEVSLELRGAVEPSRHFVISIAAGVRLQALEQWLGGDNPIVRAMPNTPALVQSGAIALSANPMVTDEQREMAESVMRSVGLTLWLDDEAQMDAVTALSGCGPAYFFLVMECLENAAADLGLSPRLARLLTLQTAFGAAKLALESEEGSAALRTRVTSPGGVTEQAINVLQQGDIQTLFNEALQAAHRRSIELADQLGGENG